MTLYGKRGKIWATNGGNAIYSEGSGSVMLKGGKVWAAGGGYAIYSESGKVTVDGAVEISGPVNCEITVTRRGRLIIPEGETLVLHQNLTNEGWLICNGTIDAHDDGDEHTSEPVVHSSNGIVFGDDDDNNGGVVERQGASVFGNQPAPTRAGRKLAFTRPKGCRVLGAMPLA